MKRNNKKLLLALTLAPAMSASAATVFFSADTTAGFFNTPADGAEFGTSFDNISNSSGLSTPVASITEATIGTTTHSIGFNVSDRVVRDDAGSGGADTLQVDFSFTLAQNVTSVLVWNYTQAGFEGRGVGDYEIYIDSGSGFGVAADYTGTLAAADHTPANHVAQEISFGGVEANVVGIRLVGLDSTDPGASALGLDEVAFSFDDTVPEPSSALLALVGTLGLLRRRR